jgi:hypothetical protein
MNAENSVSSISTLSKFWDGKPIDRIRVADGASKLYGKRLSCHLMGQPLIMAGLIADPAAQAQGFLSRFLIVTPESTIGTREYRAVNLRECERMDAYHSRVREFLEREPAVEDTSHPEKRSQLTPRRLQVSAAAKSAYVEFHDEIERALAGKLKEIRAFANKAPEHMLRIAGALTVFHLPDATEIPLEFAIATRRLVEYYLLEAHRLNEIARQDPELVLAERLAEWIKALDRPVSLIEIYQRGPVQLRNARRARHVADILISHGHLLPAKDVVYENKRRSEGYQLVA